MLFTAAGRDLVCTERQMHDREKGEGTYFLQNKYLQKAYGRNVHGEETKGSNAFKQSIETDLGEAKMIPSESGLSMAPFIDQLVHVMNIKFMLLCFQCFPEESSA